MYVKIVLLKNKGENKVTHIIKNIFTKLNLSQTLLNLFIIS